MDHARVKALLLECDVQIPEMTADFDVKNPAHMRAFEDEMTQMMSSAVAKQARVQRVKTVTSSSERGKLTRREIELASLGLHVPSVRQIQSVAEFEQGEIDAERELLPRPTPKKDKRSSNPPKAFPSRAEEGEYLSLRAYQDQTRQLKHRLKKGGTKFADYAQVVVSGPNEYRHQHVLTWEEKKKQGAFLPRACEMLSGGCRMMRHDDIQQTKAAKELYKLKAEQSLAASLS